MPLTPVANGFPRKQVPPAADRRGRRAQDEGGEKKAHAQGASGHADQVGKTSTPPGEGPGRGWLSAEALPPSLRWVPEDNGRKAVKVTATSIMNGESWGVAVMCSGRKGERRGAGRGTKAALREFPFRCCFEEERVRYSQALLAGSDSTGAGNARTPLSPPPSFRQAASSSPLSMGRFPGHRKGESC